MRDFTSELLRREIPRPLHPRRHGRAALVAAGPCTGPAWTSRAEGGAGTSRADAPRIAPAELFRREIPRPLHLGDTGGPRLSRPGPAPGLLGRPAPRVARVLRAPTRRVSTRRNCSDVKSRIPYTLDHTGGPRLSRPGPVPGPLGRPAPRAARVLRAPTRRVSPRRNCSDVKSRVPCTLGHTGGPRLSRPDRRRPRPTPHPRPNPQPPTHGPAREVPAPPSARGVRTGLPRWLAMTYEDPDIGRGARPARPSAPHAHARLGCWTPRRAPRRGRAAGDVGPYHPTRTHLAPTILPPAPTWPLPLSHPHPHRPLPFSHLHPHRPLPFSRPHPLGPDVGSTTARRAKYPRRPRRGASTLFHPMRPPHARPARRETPPKNLIFFCHRRMPTAYIHVSGFARICAAPNKTRGIRRFGRRVRRVYFFSRPPCAHGGCVVYSWRL